MNTTVLNQSIALVSVILSVLSMLLLWVGSKVDHRTKRYFVAFYTWLILFACANLAGQLLRGRPGGGYRLALYGTNFLEFLCAGTLACIGCLYILSMVDPERNLRTVRWILAGLMGLHTGLLLLSQFTGLLYTIDANNLYQRGAWFPLALVSPAGMLLLGVWILIQRRDRLSRKQRLAFLSFMAIPLLAMVIQALIYGVYIVLLAMVISMFVMFLFVVSDQTESYYRQEQENARLKINLMLSQIQPHFLYNSLTVIRELISTDPKAAERGLGEFSDFLRHNMRSIDTDKPIPFRRELEHAKSYLSLQKLRFGDELSVVFDLECENFSLPTLTLQPIVENAVSHGIRESLSGVGTVTIQSREYPDRWELRVLDDGCGFDVESLNRDSNAGLGIRNVRDRLSRVCGGSLDLRSAPGKGTEATIILPKTEHS